MDDTANVLTCYILYRELHCMTLLLASGLSKVEIRVIVVMVPLLITWTMLLAIFDFIR